MQQTIPWSRWRSWRHALKFGVPLALIELGFVFVYLTHTTITGTNLFVYLVLPSYVIPYAIIPFIAGYRFYHLRHDSTKCGWAGLRVGLVSFALVMLVISVLTAIVIVVSFNTPPAPREDGALGFVALFFFFGGMLTLNWGGMWIGGIFGQAAGVIAEWRAPVAAQMHTQEPQS